MQNFKIVDYDDPREHQEPVAKWVYDIGSKVAYIKDMSEGALTLQVRLAR